MTNILNIENKDKINEKFFKILIIKELLHKSFFEEYYINFLDTYWNFSEDLFWKIVDNIYFLVSNYDATSIRPNNSEQISEETIRNVISEYWDNYIWHKNFSEEIKIHLDFRSIELNEKKLLSKEKNDVIKKWIELYLNRFLIKNLSSNDYYDNPIETNLELFVKQIIDTIKNKRILEF